MVAFSVGLGVAVAGASPGWSGASTKVTQVTLTDGFATKSGAFRAVFCREPISERAAPRVPNPAAPPDPDPAD